MIDAMSIQLSTTCLFSKQEVCSKLDSKALLFLVENNQNMISDDLWYIEIYMKKNSEELHAKISKVEVQGKKPLGRYLHSSSILDKYLIIYGGRNDVLYNRNYSTIALNDICLYDIEQNTWEILALYGTIPKSRWGSAITTHRDHIYVFGGLSWNQYAAPLLHVLDLSQGENEDMSKNHNEKSQEHKRDNDYKLS